MTTPGGDGQRTPVFSLRRRLTALLAALVAALVVSGVVALTVIHARDSSLDTILLRLDPAAAAVARVDAALTDEQSSVFGFVLIRREDVLEPFQRARVRETEALLELEQRLKGTGLDGDVAGVRRAIDLWRTDVVEPVISAARAGRDTEARALLATGESAFDDAQGEAASLAMGIADLLGDEEERFGGARRAISQTVAANVIVGIGLFMTVTVLMRRWVAQPLFDLTQQVEAVSGGDLDRSIVPVGPAELQAVGIGVEAMRVRILAELADARRAEEGLAQRAPAVVAVGEILAPRTHDLPPGYQFAKHFEPAEGVLAGDWYEATGLPDGRVCLCIGDVAGHGAEAAVTALRARDLALTAVRLGHSPSEALSMMAESLVGEGDECFVTCFLAVIEANGAFSYANGGHHPPLLAMAGFGGKVIPLESTGPLIGPVDGAWSTSEMVLTPGSTIVAYTDGVIEGSDDSGDEYGMERLTAAVTKASSGGAAAIVSGIRNELDAFVTNSSRDDVTIVALTNSRRAN